MATASTAKRRSAFGSNGGSKKAALDAAAASKTTSDQSVTMSVAPQNASLSEKRRVAALISWQKRRGSTGSSSGGGITSSRPKSAAGESGRPVTPPGTPPKPKGKKRNEVERPAFIVTCPPVRKASLKKFNKDENIPPEPVQKKKKKAPAKKKSKPASSSTKKKVYTASDRAKAAKAGWERRKRELAATAAKRKTKETALEIRRRAAKQGWEKRKRELAAQAAAAAEAESSASSADESSVEEEEEDDVDEPPSAASSTSRAAKKTKKARGGYSAAARAKAARAGWERRKREQAEAAARRSADYSSSAASSDAEDARPRVMPALPSTAPATAAHSDVTPTETQLPRLRPNGQPYREGSKRSRRLAATDDPSHEEEIRKINEIVTYLRVARGWMEFHPSSRMGSGAHRYGYIPSSIASFVRSGSISQGVVLEHGTVGVHYALDWEGHGGLREMIERFGEDFSPYPTEKMMEHSQVPEWELGEDLPWREVEEVEDGAVMKGGGTDTAEDDGEESDIENIMYVANILASLDQDAMADASDGDEGKQTEAPVTVQVESFLPDKDMADTSDVKKCKKDVVSPQQVVSSCLLALGDYRSEDECSVDAFVSMADVKAKEGETDCFGTPAIAPEHPLSKLVDVSTNQYKPIPTKSMEGDDVLIIQTGKEGFSEWNTFAS